MKFSEALDIRPGLTAIIGSGGKSTLLQVLAEELAPATVLLCTTTHMCPTPGVPFSESEEERQLAEALALHGTVCLGTPMPDGRITAPALPMKTLMALADYVLVEADGSRTLPLKAHAPHEPVIPAEADQVVCVVGISGVGKPITAAAHRPEQYASLAGVEVLAIVTPEIAAAVLNGEGLADRYYINQVADQGDLAAARALAALLHAPAAYGSLHRRDIQC